MTHILLSRTYAVITCTLHLSRVYVLAPNGPKRVASLRRVIDRLYVPPRFTRPLRSLWWTGSYSTLLYNASEHSAHADAPVASPGACVAFSSLSTAKTLELELCYLNNIQMFRRPSSGSVGLPASPEHSRYNGTTLSAAPKRPPTKIVDTTLRRPSARSASSSQKLDFLANINAVDPDDLFTKHTVSEVKMVQQRLR